MILFIELLVIGILLFFFVTFFLDNIENEDNAIWYKLYIFLFMFFIQIMISFINSLFTNEVINYSELIDMSISNSLLTVIAFDVYHDLNHKRMLDSLSYSQKNLILILLVIGFITSIKIIQMLFYTNI